ncbi:hypothetical protein GGF46_003200 [Coemansia sp. RSA 552]|nr:hypothetical protein GGF46_003200 [Coemansia sp. RSA 552]
MDAGNGGAKAAGTWRPTDREQTVYSHLQLLVDKQGEGMIRGQAAVPFFQKSGLPDAVLGGIWQLADMDSKGHLSPQEFGVAMKLISLAQAGRPVTLASLGESTGLPELQGVEVASMMGSPFSGSSGRRDSNASSAGWASLMAGSSGDLGAAAEISAKEKQQYRQIFDKSHPVAGAISGATARALFTKTKLTGEQLGRVWALADPHSEGKLRLPGFMVAMYYIRRIMENRRLELPQTCPLALWRSAGGDVMIGSQSSLGMSTPDVTEPHWDVTKEEWQRYEKYFNSLDTQRQGYLAGAVPVDFFLKSKLPEGLLSKVWDLADTNRSGNLSKEEFAVAMHLINAQLAGRPLPDALPPTLVPPSMRRSAMVSASTHSLSPVPRPAALRDLQMSEGLRRATSSASRSPPPAAAAVNTNGAELAALQSRVDEAEGVSRALQSQRTAAANHLAVSAQRKQELEVKLSAAQSSHDVEQRINRELQDRLAAEEARVEALQQQVADAGKKLSVVAAQHAQLEQDVHRVQAQQAAQAQKLSMAQEDERQLNAEIARLEAQKRQAEESRAAAQAQTEQLEQQMKDLAKRAEELQAESSKLAREAEEAEKLAAEKRAAAAEKQAAVDKLDAEVARARAQPEETQTPTQVTAQSEREAPSFDDIFGTADSVPASAGTGGLISCSSAEEFVSAATDSQVIGPTAPMVTLAPAAHSLPAPSAVFSTMPSLGAAPNAAASVEAFDSFGAHEADPFEEFLQSAAAASRSQTRPLETVAARAMSDPRSVTSTPAPSSDHRPANSMLRSTTKSTPASPMPMAKELRSSSMASQGGHSQALESSAGFAPDFSAAFGAPPGAAEQAISQDIEAFETKFPDISALSIDGGTTGLAATAAGGGGKPDEDLTFESVFGAGGPGAEGARAAEKDTAPMEKSVSDSPHGGGPKSGPAKMGGRPKGEGLPPQKSASESRLNASEEEFVAPPVVKLVSAVRPMSRVFSMFRTSKSNPPQPKRVATERLTASEKRQQMKQEQDRKFEEQWKSGDWPSWVKRGEHLHSRRMLLEMGYSKDRVVEALEVNDFNLAQASDYLISS